MMELRKALVRLMLRCCVRIASVPCSSFRKNQSCSRLVFIHDIDSYSIKHPPCRPDSVHGSRCREAESINYFNDLTITDGTGTVGD
jgi:hypothetical protein